MTSGIYKIYHNYNKNRLYIGSAADIKARWRQHRNSLKRGEHHSYHLQRVVNKYGIDDLYFEIVEECDKDSLLIREQFWIDKYSFDDELYNHKRFAGRSFGYRHSDETRKLISQIQKGRPSNMSKERREELSKRMSGKNNWNYGKKMSDETKEKIRESLKGFRHTQEAKDKISKSQYKPVEKLDIVTGEVLQQYPSVQAAARDVGVRPNAISTCLSGVTKTSAGFKWRFVT